MTIGEGSWLYSSYAFLHFASRKPDAVRIGAMCGVYNGSFFDLGPDGTVTIGDYSTVVGAIFASNGHVSIGSYCFLAHEVVLADQPVAAPPSGSGATSTGGAPARIVIEDDVWIGTGAVILAGAHIGRAAIVCAGSIVDFSVPEGTTVAGNPATVVRRAP